MNIDFSKGMQDFSAVTKKQAGKAPSFDLTCERLTAVKADVDTAEAKGLFVPLPLPLTDEKPKPSGDRSRVKTIRNRLFILGYLNKDTGRGSFDAPMEKSIRAFQKDAGLDVDGWVGEEQTWPALQELVSFETPINLLKWYADGKPKPVLLRAIALRLFALGINKEKPTSSEVDIKTGMQAFGRIWQLLDLGDTRLTPGLNVEWVELLFDMDGITKRLADVKLPLAKEALAEVHSFVLNAAKIELWLMGYPVAPGGYDLEKREVILTGSGGLSKSDMFLRSKTVSKYLTIKRNFKFYKALHLFWTDCGKDDNTADGLSVEFLNNFSTFFLIVNGDIQVDKELSLEARQVELESFLEKNPDEIPSIWQTVRKFGARIWDGIRRVWGWFKRMWEGFKKGLRKLGTNLSRMIYNAAMGSFTVVFNVFKSFGTAIDIITEPQQPDSKPDNVLFYRDFDFDMKVLVGRLADGPKVEERCRLMQRKARQFVFASHVIGIFMFILVSAFKSKWAGYFGLVFALIKLRRQRFRFKALADEYRALFVVAA
jgi:hypothetical protein